MRYMIMKFHVFNLQGHLLVYSTVKDSRHAVKLAEITI